MINAIGEASLQQALRPQHNAVAQSEETLARESERLRQERPVEKAEDSQQSKMDLEQNDQAETASLA